MRRATLGGWSLWGYVLAGAFAYFYFESVFPSQGFVAGTSSYWQTQIQDVTQYISGLTAFRQEPWGFPLLKIHSINWPEGTSVGFTDAIPLLAIMVKLLDPIMPYNPYGVWVLLCFVLMGTSALWAARQAGIASPMGLILVVALCVQMPSLIQRLGHLSLMAHFLVVIAIGLYFRDRTYKDVSTIGWTVLVFCSFYINFYLTGMVLTIMIASAADLAISGNINRLWKYPLTIVPAFALYPLMYGFGSGSNVFEGGFNYYSMNLLSPIVGGSIIHFPSYAQGTGGQYEGYNYLGLGLIAALLLSLGRGGIAGRVGPALAVAGFGLFIYSLSNDIYLSTFLVARWDAPQILNPIFDAFRVSGRFFWPVSYLLVFCVAISIARLKFPSALVFLVAVLSVQWVDLQSIRGHVHELSRRAPETPADVQTWSESLAGAETIYFYPKFRCGNANNTELLPIQLLAANLQVRMTTGYIARYSPDCAAEAREVAEADVSKSAFVYALTDFGLDDAIEKAPPGTICREQDAWVLCR